jgi:hypothetical protein
MNGGHHFISVKDQLLWSPRTFITHSVHQRDNWWLVIDWLTSPQQAE